MRVLKTIVATVVIIFTLTTVAMAGVQHFTKQSGQTAAVQTQLAQSAGAQAQQAQGAAAPAQQVRLTQQVQQAQRVQLSQSQSQLTAARSMEQQARHVYSQRHTERATMGMRGGSTMGIRSNSPCR